MHRLFYDMIMERHFPSFVAYFSDEELIEKWRVAEVPFARNNYYGARRSDGAQHNFQHIWRDSQLLLKAPHGVWHRGNSQQTRVEPGTGGMALLVAETIGASVKVRTASCFHRPLKQYFTEIDAGLAEANTRGVCRVIDIHGCRNTDAFDVAIGLGPDPIPSAAWQWGGQAATIFAAHGLRPMLHGNCLRGDGPHTTATKTRAYPNMLALQLEFTTRTRLSLDGTTGPLAPGALRALRALAKEAAVI